MRFLAGLKRLCDACFCFSFAGFVALLFGGSSLLAALPFFAAAAFLSALLAGKGLLQFAPLALLAGAFLVVPLHPANAIALAPACFLMARSAFASRKGLRRFEYDRVFKAFLGLAFAQMVFALFFRQWPLLERSLFPFGVVFVACACVLMRMSRHDDQVARDGRFKIFNALSVAAVLLVALAVGSGWFLGLAGAALGFVYQNAIVPLLLLIVYPLAFVMHRLAMLLLRRPVEIAETEIDEMAFFLPDGELQEAHRTGRHLVEMETISNALAVLLGALAVFLLVRLLMRLAQDAGSAPAGAAEARLALAPRKPRAQRRRGNRIRETYRKFLALCRKDGMEIPAHATSQDVERMAALMYGQDGSKELREIYARARYGDCAGGKADERRAREILRAVARSAGKPQG